MTASNIQSLPCEKFTAEKHHIGYSHLNTGVSRKQIQMVYTPNFDKKWNQPKTDSVSGALNAEPDTTTQQVQKLRMQKVTKQVCAKTHKKHLWTQPSWESME